MTTKKAMAAATHPVFGNRAIAMILQPVAGSLAVVWLMGTYGLIFGELLLGAGLRMKPASPANTLS